MEEFAESVLDYANWVIAHRTRKTPEDVTWGDVHRTLNRIFDTYAQYYNIITANTWMGKYPAIQYDWAAPFAFAWITKDFKEWEPPE